MKPKTDASVGRPKPPPPPPPPPPSPAAEANGNASTNSPAPTPQAQPATQPVAPATAPSPPPTAVAQQLIQLSTGVALAQTLPDEGTVMMFSVDYEVAQGEPSASGYVWVIERRTAPRRSCRSN